MTSNFLGVEEAATSEHEAIAVAKTDSHFKGMRTCGVKQIRSGFGCGDDDYKGRVGRREETQQSVTHRQHA